MKYIYYEHRSDTDAAVLGYIRFYKSINNEQAQKSFGVVNLKSVIDRLRMNGHLIEQNYFFRTIKGRQIRYVRYQYSG